MEKYGEQMSQQLPLDEIQEVTVKLETASPH